MRAQAGGAEGDRTPSRPRAECGAQRGGQSHDPRSRTEQKPRVGSSNDYATQVFPKRYFLKGLFKCVLMFLIHLNV